MRKPDEAHRWTDEQLAELEKRIAEEYKEAAEELQENIERYFAGFKKRDEEMKSLIGTVVNGKVYTEGDYKQWRLAQIGRGKRFEGLRDKLAERYTKANEVTTAYTNDTTPGIYSLNRNYAAYTIEQVSGNVGFTLWDEQTVRRLIVEQPELMPYYPPERAVKRGIDLAWGKRQITASVTSSILQGKSIKHMADDLQSRIQTMNRTSAIRTARTAVTGAQNAGRQDAFVAAAKMGIRVEKKWVATKDSRTRHDHGMADGQIVPYDKPFHVGGYELMYPGDQSGPPHEIYNCRCRMVYGSDFSLEAEPRQMRVRDPATGRNVVVNEMTYSEWKKWVQIRQYNDIIGVETANGIIVQSLSAHTVERAGERSVSQSDVLDAIRHPMYVGDITTDAQGRRSQRFLGANATVNINPDTGNIVTVWKTGKKTREKYGKGDV